MRDEKAFEHKENLEIYLLILRLCLFLVEKLILKISALREIVNAESNKKINSSS